MDVWNHEERSDIRNEHIHERISNLSKTSHKKDHREKDIVRVCQEKGTC